MTGLEPATSGVTGRRSNQLSYIRNLGTRETRGAPNRSRPESCQRQKRSRGSASAGFSGPLGRRFVSFSRCSKAPFETIGGLV